MLAALNGTVDAQDRYVFFGYWMTKDGTMKDENILGHINQLVEEEQRLYSSGDLGAEDTARLQNIQVELDQCWDLLRQRRAKREFHQDPDTAKPRSPEIVENYEQ
jgi:hypothetical protein